MEGRGVTACTRCLKRAHLLGELGPRFARIRRRRDRKQLLLALPNRELIRAVAGEDANRLIEQLQAFDADEMRSRLVARGLSATCFHDPAFPAVLTQLPDVPGALFVRGDPARLADLAATPAVAIVGSRRASTYALEVAHELGRSLARVGVPVVSGLARGVDGAAHRGALAGSGLTVGVLASGADVPYPPRHRELYRRVAQSGLVLSEMPPGTEPRKWAFPARNRIMAGLAAMTVVVEAAEASGSLITATFAGDLGREIGAVPGRVNAWNAAGSNRLLADGAVTVRHAEDVLDCVFGAGMRSVPPPSPIALDPRSRDVLSAIEAGQSPVASIDGDIRGVRAALGRLEALGLVRRDGLGGYERTGMQCEPA
jgi:DNA processing protein